MRSNLLAIFLLIAGTAYGQQSVTDSSHALGEVVITGFQRNITRYTSLNIEPYSLKQMNEHGPYNLSDALAKLPGVSQMTTGNAISKPVIRGLYGNRILMLYSGMRFDNQQWQDEHGLGLSQIGIDRVEVIKGPASLLYGSDAMGGVINVIEEKPIKQGTKVDVGTELFSNTRGTLTDAGINSRNGNMWWRLRLGAENNADYSDGAGNRVFNSRNKAYYVKAGWGFDKAKWKQENSYNFSYNQFGFIIEDLLHFFPVDDRWSRAMSGPHHNVMLNLLTSQNTFQLNGSVLNVNVGFQSNQRAEDEGGGAISLDMRLLSGLESARWEKALSSKVTFVANQQLTYENNTNFGGRILIPDATFVENNASGYFKIALSKVIVEVGAGINDKYIKTLETRQLNAPGEPIQPFTKNNVVGNGMLGAAYNPNDWLTVKANLATGSRSPNLAELSSNGVHEGVYRYEIGDPNLKPEQNLNTDITLEMNREEWLFSVSGFNNQFKDYVYLSPTNDTFYRFPVFKYRQQDAHLYGGEAFLSIAPKALKGLELKECFTYTHGNLANGEYMPFIPAYKLSSSVRYERKLNGKVQRVFLEPELINVFAQNRPAQFETPTPAYYLLNFTSGVELKGNKGNWRIGLAGTNLTNQVYVDHLSRLKYIVTNSNLPGYKLYNQGINFVLSVRKELLW